MRRRDALRDRAEAAGQETLTPSDLSRALDLIGYAIEGGATPAQKAQAREDLTCIRGLLRDVRTTPDDVLIGRQAPVFKPSVTLMKLQVVQPRDPVTGAGALDAILRWVESLRGRRGRSVQDMTLVGHDDEWTKLLIQREPEVIGGARRGNGLDNDQPPAAPSP